jgi:lipid II:glycine glycyltransferase (peptidoglycan interpeptide bridge formation enzyme)
MPYAAPINGEMVVSILEAEGLRRHRLLTASERFLVNLSLPVDKLYMGLHSTWRHNLRRAQRQGLEAVEVDGHKAVDLFTPLYHKMLKRKSFTDHSAIGQFPQFYADLPGPLKPRVVLCLDRGEPVAGNVISFVGDTAVYLFGATNERGLEVRGGYFLHWWVVNWLREQGYRWYDLGGDEGNAGLRRFKAHLVGNCGVITHLPGDFNLCGSVPSLVTARFATGLKDVYLKTRERLKPLTRL